MLLISVPALVSGSKLIYPLPTKCHLSRHVLYACNFTDHGHFLTCRSLGYVRLPTYLPTYPTCHVSWVSLIKGT